MKILYSDWMRDLDSEAINNIKIPSIVLMENAATSVASIILSEIPRNSIDNVIVMAGPGNNGGDGIAIGRKFFNKGFGVRLLLLSDPGKYRNDTLVNLEIVKRMGVKPEFIKDSKKIKYIIDKYDPDKTIIIDAIFGTGLERPVTGDLYPNIIQIINNSKSKTISVDIPSGLSDKFDSRDHSCIDAFMTVTFQALKISHFFPEDIARPGKLRVTDIGIPANLLNSQKYYVELITSGFVSHVFQTSSLSDHKGNYGHSLVIAGSNDKPGAAMLSAAAALRSGGGLVTCTINRENDRVMKKWLPEVMTIPHSTKITGDMTGKKFRSVLAGPGMGTGSEIKDNIIELIRELSIPLILDADAINVLQGSPDILLKKIGEPVIITPHPLEFSRISGVSLKQVKGTPVNTVRDFSMKYKVYTILKGHRSIVGTPDGNIYVNDTGNPGMGTAGSGDVLAGVILGLVSRTIDHIGLERILPAAVFMHGLAGDLACNEKSEVSMTASDILEMIPSAVKKIDEYRSDILFI